MRVYVLLFNAGTENEGIHTLQIGGRNLVLMFESEDDATRYALLLEAQDFPLPSVEPIDQEEVEAFCEDANYACQLVPAGYIPESDYDRLLLSPPERTVEQMDWSADQPPRQPLPDDEEASSLSAADLDRIRRQLEGLL
ncbi:DUF3110 domain-containing protein [Trichothermofontia sp.]